jgi:hypothetical protein
MKRLYNVFWRCLLDPRLLEEVGDLVAQTYREVAKIKIPNLT